MPNLINVFLNKDFSSEELSTGGAASFLLGNDILRKPTLIRAISSINRWPKGQIPYTIASNFSKFTLRLFNIIFPNYNL